MIIFSVITNTRIITYRHLNVMIINFSSNFNYYFSAAESPREEYRKEKKLIEAITFNLLSISSDNYSSVTEKK